MRGVPWATVAVALVIVSGGLAGCVGEDQAMVARIDAAPLSGELPLTVWFNLTAYNPAGTPITIKEYTIKDGVRQGEGLTGGNGGPGSLERPAVFGSTTYVEPGTYVDVLEVSDGVKMVTTNVTITVTGIPERFTPLFTFIGNVTQTCFACSGAVPPYIGTVVPLGASACAGFFANSQGGQCIWASLPPGLEGKPFIANATDYADAEVDFRTDCTPTSQSVAIFANEGREAHGVPVGAHCVVLWTFRTAPAAIGFWVYP